MRKERCVNGHYYDADKYEKCPHCGINPQIAKYQNSGTDLYTNLKGKLCFAEEVKKNEIPPVSTSNNDYPEQNKIKTEEIYSDTNTDIIEEATVALNDSILMGWLICLTGRKKGEFYSLYAEEKNIDNMLLSYDYSTQEFSIFTNDGDNIKINDRIVTGKCFLSSNDVIENRNGKYKFVLNK